ncbi:gpW family head-tail joining protein [Paracoccus sp. KR1-242]|uniref:gpW family head-tail joining protein n=1 Tax=Paracoccus sp. KR1-242 TaxID=3410028 RepID=UPI003C02D2EB
MPLIIDEDDPCDAARQLRALYYQLLAGQAVSEVEYQSGSNGVRRRVKYTSANAAGLLALIQKFESDCALIDGRRPRRFGIATGGRF